MTRFFTALVFGASLLAACSPKPDGGVNLAAMDTSVRPGADFYSYANRGWQPSTQNPADRSSIGAFYVAFLETERQTTELVDGIRNSNPQAGTDAARIANFYNAYVTPPPSTPPAWRRRKPISLGSTPSPTAPTCRACSASKCAPTSIR
jgi:hypothetical protein